MKRVLVYNVLFVSVVNFIYVVDNLNLFYLGLIKGI